MYIFIKKKNYGNIILPGVPYYLYGDLKSYSLYH